MALLCASTGWADTTLTNGVKFGEGRLHSYFDLEERYDSAAGYFPGAPLAASNGLAPEMVTHFRPGLALDVPSETLALKLDGNLDYVWYTGLLTPNSNAASRLQAGASVDAEINPTGPVGVSLKDHFSRSDRTQNAAVAVGVLSLFNEFTAAIPFRPGGGALEVTPSAAYGVEFFSPILTGTNACTLAVCNADTVASFNYQNLRFGVTGRYRFLPKTALVFDADYNDRIYFNPGANLPAHVLRTTAGLAGLVSPRVAVVVKAGYGRDFSSTASTVVGQAEGSYLVSADTTVKLGYLRTLSPVPVYGVLGDDRFYLDSAFGFGERVHLRGYTAYDILTFYGPGRHDSVFSLLVGPEWDILRWLKGSVGYLLEVRRSDAASASVLNYQRHEGYVRLTLQY